MYCGANSLILDAAAKNRIRRCVLLSKIPGSFSLACLTARLLACLLACFALLSPHNSSKRHHITANQRNQQSSMVKSGRGRYNTGHWTDDENRLLHVGLERHGRDWVAISRVVGTRCVFALLQPSKNLILMCRFLGFPGANACKIPALPRTADAIQLVHNIYWYLVVSGGIGSVRREGLRIRQSQKCTLRAEILQRYAQKNVEMSDHELQLE